MIDKIKMMNEASRCLLCNDAKCTKACPNKMDPAKFIRSIRFENEGDAVNYIDKDVCNKCDAPCEKACIHFERPINIKELVSLVRAEKVDISDVDLSIDFCGVKCENPFFLGSSVIGSNYEMCAKALEAGWGGIVVKTIGFYRPHEASPRFSALSKEGTPFVGFKNLEQISDHSLEFNLKMISDLKKNYPNKIIVASIMSEDEEGWTKLASLCEEAGADMIECNFSCPQVAVSGMGSDVGQNKELVAKYTKATKAGTKLPVLTKMTPNIEDMTVPAIASVENGADGLSAINTIKCIVNVNLDDMTSDPMVDGKCSVSGYSGKAVKPIALRFIHDMSKSPELKNIPISGIGGIETWKDACEFFCLGCENIQVTTVVMQYGYRIVEDLITGTKLYMKKHGYKKISDFVGKALDTFVPASELNRDTMVFPKFNTSTCVGCGRCYISCYDGGHQAIDMINNKPRLNGSKCVGCLLCSLVCPTRSISRTKRVRKPREFL